MFTHALTRNPRWARVADLLLGPHGVDRYTELVDPMWTRETRAAVVRVARPTPRSVTLWLRPNHPASGRYRAGQHLTVTVEVDGRRRVRCYSPANAETDGLIELTVTRHEGGTVSEHLVANARPGMVVGLSAPAGDFVLPDVRPRRIVFVAGGSGITPVLGMLRTLAAEGYDGDVAVLHYVRTPEDACYRGELAEMGVRVLYACTRSGDGDLTGHLDQTHLRAAMEDPDAVYVCGPPALVDAVRELHPDAKAESFSPRPFVVPDTPGGGRITFSDSGIQADDDGRTILEQAEKAGLTPKSGCRMGICHTCTRRKTSGAVRNLTTNAVSTADGEDVQICVSVPVGDVDIAL